MTICQQKRTLRELKLDRFLFACCETYIFVTIRTPRHSIPSYTITVSLSYRSYMYSISLPKRHSYSYHVTVRRTYCTATVLVEDVNTRSELWATKG